MKTISIVLSTALLLLIACGGGTPAGKTKLAAPQGDQIYFGAFPDFGGSENNVSTQKVKDFETIGGKKIAWACFSQNWYNGIKYPKEAIHAIAQSGATPYVRLMPRSDEIQGHAEKKYSMKHIIDASLIRRLKNGHRMPKKTIYRYL